VRKSVLVMALIGGRGSRMDVLCKSRPKPLIPMAGAYRLIDFTLTNCIQSRLPALALVGDYLHDEAFAYLESWQQHHGDELSMTFLKPAEGNYAGTADAVFRNLSFVKDYKAEAIVVLAGDHIYSMDYRDMLKFHSESKADVSVGVVRVPARDVHRYGCVTLGKAKRIGEFVEKPERSEDNLVSMGIYIFRPAVLADYLTRDSRQPGSVHDFGYSLLPALVKERRVLAFEFGGYWKDVGTIESYYQGNMDLLAMFSDMAQENWMVYTQRPGFSPCPQNSGNVVNSLLGRDCQVLGRVEHSILGDRVMVDSGALVRNSIIMDDSYIGVDSEVLTAVIDERVSIGAQSIVGYLSEGQSGPLNVSVVGRMVNLPSHCIVGRHCTVIPAEPNSSRALYNVERSLVALPD
jgi:glucose-1-phosphate adenylyltransferase